MEEKPTLFASHSKRPALAEKGKSAGDSALTQDSVKFLSTRSSSPLSDWTTCFLGGASRRGSPCGLVIPGGWGGYLLTPATRTGRRKASGGGPGSRWRCPVGWRFAGKRARGARSSVVGGLWGLWEGEGPCPDMPCEYRPPERSRGRGGKRASGHVQSAPSFPSSRELQRLETDRARREGHLF